MVMGDYEQLAARAFDEPFDTDVRDSMLVCADALGQVNDPRGPLITMEHALRDAEPRRAVELRRAIQAHVLEHAPALLGGVASLMTFKRALSLEWRAGRIFGASIDARYLPQKAGISAAELVQVFIKAPAARSLRRLRVRLRCPAESIVAMLTKCKQPLPLEELELGRRVWPTQITSGNGNRDHTLLEKYPNLYYLGIDDELHQLPLAKIPDVLLVDPPVAVQPRVLLGRALTAFDAKLRAAAFQRVVALGVSASVYTRVLTVLAQPGVCAPQHELVDALAALGPTRENLYTLAKLSSRPRYADEVRSAAGSACTRLRAAL
ncbi:MAG: hypothetical protein ABI867_34615 [Kofleriaceae bacterium]